MALIRSGVRVLTIAFQFALIIYGWGIVAALGIFYLTTPPWERPRRLELALTRAVLWPGVVIGRANVHYDPPGTYAI